MIDFKMVLKEESARYDRERDKIVKKRQEEIGALNEEIEALNQRFSEDIALKPGTIIEDNIGRGEIIKSKKNYYYRISHSLLLPTPEYTVKNFTKNGTINKECPTRIIRHSNIIRIILIP